MENLDVVYILGKGSRWHDNELRFSLRSLEKNFTFRDVYIIGECPEWLQNITHIPVEDAFKNKLMNARVKYLAAINDERISDDFILMNDDFYFLKPVEKINYYSRGTIDGEIRRHRTKAGYYFNAIVITHDKLLDLGMKNTLMDFEVHAPIIFNKEKLMKAIKKVGDTVCLLRTCYGNMQDVDFEVVDDFKVSDEGKFRKQLNKDRSFLSITDTMVVSDMFRAWIWNKYPEQSRFEKHIDMKEKYNVIDGLRYYATRAFMYHTKSYGPGDLIDFTTIKEIKLNKSLELNWEYK